MGKLKEDSNLSNPDVVHSFEGKWYFYDEIWDRNGPYDSERDARLALGKYCKEYLGIE